VTLGPGHGGRNQELVLAALAKLGEQGMRGVVVLSGGTDGEDGPTDAAGLGAALHESKLPGVRALSQEGGTRRTEPDALSRVVCVSGRNAIN
jgi:glycerate-2-kinase